MSRLSFVFSRAVYTYEWFQKEEGPPQPQEDDDTPPQRACWVFRRGTKSMAGK